MQSPAASQERSPKAQNLLLMRHVAHQWVHHRVLLQRLAMSEAEYLLGEAKRHRCGLRHP
jgi:hypothetical protein